MARTVGLVAVGVDDTGGALRKLAGAAKGALQMAAWLDAQKRFGVIPVVKTLTDMAGPVALQEIQDAVKDLVDRGDLDLLILYFSGHGMVKAALDEQVLLSRVRQYKQEAVAIAPTALNARFSGIPHVVIISDACRNAIDPYGPLGTVAGSAVIDRGAVIGTQKGKVDVFYATEPSQTAKEFKGEGFFTQVLLDAFKNPSVDVCDVWPGLKRGVAVVPTWKLETYLGVEVPVRAAKQAPPFDQAPDFSVTSRQPQFLGYVDEPMVPPPGAGGRTKSGGGNDEDAPQVVPSHGSVPPSQSRQATTVAVNLKAGAIDKVLQSVQAHAFGLALTRTEVFDDAGLREQVESYVDSDRGRQAFETRTGYTVVGEPIETALLSSGRQLKPDPRNADAQDLRLHPAPFDTMMAEHEARGSVALVMRSGTVCILPVMPGYIGTLHVKEGRVASLSFEVSKQLRRFLPETDREREVFAQRRAMAAALVSSGRLQKLAPSEGSIYATFMRQSKRADPTLGIYASYAYALSGDVEGADSVFDWFRQYPSLDPHNRLAPAPVPFDVAMLAGRLTPETVLHTPGVAPFCPLMSLGWSVMSSFPGNHALHDAIISAGKHRLNSEWTTFRAQDIRPLLKAFERGEIL